MKGGLLVAGGSLKKLSGLHQSAGALLASLCLREFVSARVLFVVSKQHQVHGAKFISTIVRPGPPRVVCEAHRLCHALKAIRVDHGILIQKQHVLARETGNAGRSNKAPHTSVEGSGGGGGAHGML